MNILLFKLTYYCNLLITCYQYTNLLITDFIHYNVLQYLNFHLFLQVLFINFACQFDSLKHTPLWEVRIWFKNDNFAFDYSIFLYCIRFKLGDYTIQAILFYRLYKLVGQLKQYVSQNFQMKTKNLNVPFHLLVNYFELSSNFQVQFNELNHLKINQLAFAFVD